MDVVVGIEKVDEEKMEETSLLMAGDSIYFSTNYSFLDYWPASSNCVVVF